ncbi:hypothetical protein H0H93_006276 [Arthromyces matolae]|nr:hypothetical protein H0H93_006276 [Arthromyces matolae]
MDATILIPLTQLDQSYLDQYSLTIGHVAQALDIDALRAALLRVIDKWRLPAGYVEWSKTLSSWCIRVPLEGDVSSRLKFSSKKIASRLHPSFVVNERTTAHILTRPPLMYFRHDSVPHSLRSYSSSRSPIVSVHVTELANCVCFGFTFPHGVFDGFGLGQFRHALDSEFHGKPWEPPAISEFNILREALDDLYRSPSMYDDIHAETATYSALRRSFAPATAPNVLRLIGHVEYDRIRHIVESKAVFLGPRAIAKLLGDVKGELKGDKVSTNDVLAAWILKAMHTNETDDGAPCLLSQVSIREGLAGKYPALRDYTHNAIVTYPMAPFTKAELAAMSLGQLAILHREAFKPAGKIAWIQAYNTYLNKALGGHLTFPRRGGDEPWMYTNQTRTQLDKLDFGSKGYVTWFWLTPQEYSNTICINKFQGGYLIQANARSTRWRAVAKAVEELQELETHL